MEYVYGAMLLHSAGKKVTEANLKKVMTASGVKVDNARIKALVASLEGVNIDEAIKTAAPVASAPAAPTVEAEAKEEKEEIKKKEKKEEVKTEEEVASGLASLFG